MKLRDDLPAFWKSEFADVEEAMRHISKGMVSVCGHSAGGRNLSCVKYGKSNPRNPAANYSSALGAGDITAYRSNKFPVLMIVSGIHGFEFEGIVSVLNLIHIFEHGVDLAGQPNEFLAALPQSFQIILLPCINPDGRERVPYRTAVGVTREEFRKYDQGLWKDGTLCGWPECKRHHPIKEASSLLGGYFNDEGVNIVHDNFFHPMAPETQCLLDAAERYAPDMIVQMHGHGAIGKGHLIFSTHQREELQQKWLEIEDRYVRACADNELVVLKCRHSDSLHVEYFNIDDALHCCCGAMVCVHESDQGVLVRPGDEEKLDRRHWIIYKKQMLFYETIARYLAEEYQNLTRKCEN